jgi:transcriptional regulator with XRE-family HTH domain
VSEIKLEQELLLLGAAFREIREQRGLSVGELAVATGVARSPEGSRHAGAVALLSGASARAGDGQVEGDFREPRWETINDIEELVECTVAVWAPGSYTAGAIAGDEGERLRSLLAENVGRVGKGILD